MNPTDEIKTNQRFTEMVAMMVMMKVLNIEGRMKMNVRIKNYPTVC